MDQIDKDRLVELSERLRSRLENYGDMGETMRNHDLCAETLEDALELAHHILRLNKRGHLPTID